VNSLGTISRRTIVVPLDLWVELEHLARADGFESVPAFIVCELQKVATGTRGDRHAEYLTALNARKKASRASL